mgnify:CR=1 FL=1
MEVLVGIAVMVPLTLASVSGLLLGMKVSSSTQTDQRMETELTAATEDLAATPYLICGTAGEYQQMLEAWSGKLGVERTPQEQARRPDVGVTGIESRDGDAFRGTVDFMNGFTAEARGTISPGGAIDKRCVIPFIRDVLVAERGLVVVEVVTDPARFDTEARMLEEEGFDVAPLWGKGENTPGHIARSWRVN